VLGPADRFFSILIGGSAAGTGPRIELQVETDATWAAAWQTTVPGIDLLQQRAYEIPPSLTGRQARIVIVDDSPAAHVSVDYARLTADPPRPERRPLWGIADYHAHPMAYLAFGALRGVQALWGKPGGAVADYARNPSLIENDIPPCSGDHGGGHTAGVFINTIEKRLLPHELAPRGFKATVAALFKLLTGHFTRHGDHGADDFEDYPSFLSGAHQQMHVTQVHRAWQGGLRLMVALAVNNQGVEYLAAPPRDTPPSTDRETLEAQVCAVRRLATLNAEWMQIAYSPEEARDVIGSGRLAVIVGAELDGLGSLGFPSPDDEVQYLWELGVRQVTPVHGIDNRLGGAAVFEPAYNTLSDLVQRGAWNLTRAGLASREPVFFDVRDAGCGNGPLADPRGDCVLFKLGPRQERAILARTVFSPFSATPMLHAVDVPQYREHRGHLNARGLTENGRRYVRSLLSRGMLVGLEHMSEQSVADVYDLVAGSDHPLFVSHAHFRALAVQDRRRTSFEGFLPDEFDVGDRLLSRVRESGGAVGVFMYENPIDEHPVVTAPFANDCSASSKAFAYSLLYGLERLGGHGVGLATDLGFIPATAPRFGENACWGLKDHWDARPEGGPLRDQYHPERQTDGVRYEARESSPGMPAGINAPLKPYTMGRRTFDFNVDGLAHYGLLPDLWQDVKNIGLGSREFDALFSSAEAYVVMWERAARASSDSRLGQPFTPRPLPCDEICRGLCP
jgi:microsomal dipeptidase-like Zn-dependent dipeptidase